MASAQHAAGFKPCAECLLHVAASPCWSLQCWVACCNIHDLSVPWVLATGGQQTWPCEGGVGLKPSDSLGGSKQGAAAHQESQDAFMDVGWA